MAVTVVEDHEIAGAENEVDAPVEEHQKEIGECIFNGIEFPVAIVAEQNLQSDDDTIHRGSDQKEYLFLEVFHGAKNSGKKRNFAIRCC